VLVIAGALGMPARMYARLGEFLSAYGVACVAFDYRGCGPSRAAAGQEPLLTLDRWGTQDIDAALRESAVLYPGVPLFLMGHGLGAALFPLAHQSEQLTAAVLVAPGMPHSSRFPWPDNFLHSLTWRLRLPLATRGAGHKLASVPGMDGAEVPRAVLRQWAAWARRKDYLFDPRFRLDTSHFDSLRIPMLAVTISDDESAPAEVAEPLLERFPNARIERRRAETYRLGIGSIGHLGFFRSKCRDAMWYPVLEWILRHRGRGESGLKS
jgi:predicted alpha/beta hydrolase